METVWLKTLHALVFLELVHPEGARNPSDPEPRFALVTQQARTVAAALKDQETLRAVPDT